MAQNNSSKTSAARKKAEEAARKIQEQQTRLLHLAEEYFAVADTAGVTEKLRKIEEHENKIKDLRAEIAVAEQDIESKQALLVQQLKDENINNTEIAERLMLSATDVTRLLRVAKEVKQTDLAKTGTAAAGVNQGQTD